MFRIFDSLATFVNELGLTLCGYVTDLTCRHTKTLYRTTLIDP